MLRDTNYLCNNEIKSCGYGYGTLVSLLRPRRRHPRWCGFSNILEPGFYALVLENSPRWLLPERDIPEREIVLKERFDRLCKKV